MNERILIIDDDHFLCRTIADFFEDLGFVCRMEHDGQAGLAAIDGWKPEIVLCDLRMPVMDGFEVLKQTSATAPDLPVVVVSGVGVISEAINAIRLGAWDFVTKPMHDMKVLEHRVGNALEKARLREQNRRYREHLEQEVLARTNSLREEIMERLRAQEELQKINREIITTQKELILLLGDVVEHRSRETANHVRRVAEMSYLLAVRAGIPEHEAEILRMAAPMHDVGKISVPDAILNKPGKLTSEEFAVIKGHTIIGYDILGNSERRIMKAAAIVALQHHERWDGKGYPQGLEGEGIHILGRITCIADVFDALSQRRVYKEPWPLDSVLELFRKESGHQFDPHLVDVLFEAVDGMRALMAKYPDESAHA